MELISLNFEKREVSGKGACGRLRKEGFIPAVFYGPEYKEAVSVKVSAQEIVSLIKEGHWETHKFEVELPNGNKEMCIIRDVDRNYVNGDVRHIDFYQLVRGHKVAVNVPIEVVGEEACEGVKMGGALRQIMHEVEINVLPIEMPEKIVVDVTSLALGESYSISDLAMPESAESVKELSEMVLEIVALKADDEEEAEATEEAEA